ncbi:hypothetical protein AZE42_09421 [Rhizopogon vesiculosus]|uniref:Uncharacterized protein n=1 Tax=Rhizopogon vesiculosus TaxID=180088 RepID=A0A1J8Q725_9AGAM|nr:hypothetical protein AZE42_09421 [Rhizopogon vesiculosus]
MPVYAASLFEPKRPDADEHHDATNDSDEHSITAENLGPEFSIETWPVADRCKGLLEDFVSSHDAQPLPACDEKHVLIPPFQYESKLKGILVEGLNVM